MTRIVITGANGFLGKNLIRACNDKNIVTIPICRENIHELKESVKNADYVFHFAAVMRPQDDQEFEDINVGLTRSILDYINESDSKPVLVFASSIHATLDTAYGKSKLKAERLIKRWCEDTDNSALCYRLPNVFGPMSNPHNTSVMATFCYNLSHNMPIAIHDKTHEITLVYVADLIRQLLYDIQQTFTGFTMIPIENTHRITIGSLARLIELCHDSQMTSPSLDINQQLCNNIKETYSYFKKLP